MNNKNLNICIFCTLVFAVCSPQNVGAFNFPDTGQVTDFTDTFGEDSDYTINTPSYSLQTFSDGKTVVTDENTGLKWYPSEEGDKGWSDALDYCDNLTIENISNWRLPQKKELLSIVNYDGHAPAIECVSKTDNVCNETLFPNIESRVYWTATFSPVLSYAIWGIDFTEGTAKLYNNTTGYQPVICVSGEYSFSEDFTNNQDGTITDKSTMLMWQQYRIEEALSWGEAINACEQLDFAGYENWRLPNVKELESISSDNTYDPAANLSFFPDFSNHEYWSSTVRPSSAYYKKVWLVQFHYSYVEYQSVWLDSLPRGALVRCVRGPIIKGDINGNGSVDLEDVIIGLQALTGGNPAGLNTAGDVNDDECIGLEDVLYDLNEVSQ